MSSRAMAKTPRVVSLRSAVRKRVSDPLGPTRSAARHFLSVLDLSHAELAQVLALADVLKRERAAGRLNDRTLTGKHVALLFEKPSLRTRSTFTIAVRELGGDVIELPGHVALGDREAIEDVSRNLERWVAVAVVRTFAHEALRRFAAAATRMRVINALTDEEHPCQMIADLMTLREHFGELTGRTLAFVGDGNNVATSLAHAGAMTGLNVRIASPKGYELQERVIRTSLGAAREGATITLLTDPYEAVKGADAVYTDVWTSMGQETQAAKRERIFRPYQVNARLMASARPHAVFMHCLPAHRGAEVTDEVMDSAASLVFDQAENRLHAQKALLSLLVGR
jgi:ornithine carbamoyltransferase